MSIRWESRSSRRSLRSEASSDRSSSPWEPEYDPVFTALDDVFVALTNLYNVCDRADLPRGGLLYKYSIHESGSLISDLENDLRKLLAKR